MVHASASYSRTVMMNDLLCLVFVPRLVFNCPDKSLPILTEVLVLLNVSLNSRVTCRNIKFTHSGIEAAHFCAIKACFNMAKK